MCNLIHPVAHNGHLKIVEFLTKSESNVNEVNSDGDTPLFLTATDGHQSVIEYLIQNSIENQE